MPPSQVASSCRSTRCSRAPQVAYILGDCDVRVLVTTHQRWESVREDAKGCRALAHVLLVDADRAPSPSEDEVRVHALSALLGDVVDPPPAAAAIDVDPAAILYTSGSTGRPKGVVLSATATCSSGAESVSDLPRQRRRRRHPGRAPAELRRRAEPGHDRVRRRRPRRAGQLPPGPRRRTPVRAPPRHRPDLRPAAVDPARRRRLAGRGHRVAALLRQHRRPDAPADPRPGCARSSRRPARS